MWPSESKRSEDKELCEKPEAGLGKKRAQVELGAEEVCPISLSLNWNSAIPNSGFEVQNL